MARTRRPEDWDKDLAGARQTERWLSQVLAIDPRLDDVTDHTGDFDKLDFSFLYRGERVYLDLKEKKSVYSIDHSTMWPDIPTDDLFILDETVYRRIVWQGGGGYLLIRDQPVDRWLIFGPWELTLGPRVRYQRWGKRSGPEFLKGKILLDLNAAADEAPVFEIDRLLHVVTRARELRDQVEAVPIRGHDIPELGRDE
jgi:hypothetical protein